MASNENSLADRSGNLFESHKGYDPRLRVFYFIAGALLLLLIGGLARQQIIKTDAHLAREKMQSQRRVLIPGPRGNIYDRNGEVLVRNRPRLAFVIYLDELQGEFLREFRRIRKNYFATGDKDLPSAKQLEALARTSIAQGYLNQINTILGYDLEIDSEKLEKHFARERFLPFALVDDLQSADYARLIERLPVTSAIQPYTSSTREYPFGSAAAHTLGYVGADDDISPDGMSGEKLQTFKMAGTVGREGLERKFDKELHGETGGAIFRVDHLGNKNQPLEKRLPVQGRDLTTSLDIDLQLSAETAIGDQIGSAVALDVRTGEVLVLASKPDYNLSDTSPRISNETWQSILERKALTNQAVAGAYPPGSTFKILTAIAALRAGAIQPDQSIINCDGFITIGRRPFYCYNGLGHHGDVLLTDAIAHSCDVYFYEAGKRLTAPGIAAEARRFLLDQRTGIELPGETTRMIIPDPDWKRKVRDESWFEGDTANMSIGQGDVLVTPLVMACFIASVARNEVSTKPTLIHNPDAPTQRTEPIGLTAPQRAALIAGMEGTVTYGTAAKIMAMPIHKIPGVRIAGKTGTAQKDVVKDGKKGKINFAWFICFAPVEKPEIAVAVMLEGETIGEEFGGGREAAPIAATIMKKFFEKKSRPAALITPLKTVAN